MPLNWHVKPIHEAGSRAKVSMYIQRVSYSCSYTVEEEQETAMKVHVLETLRSSAMFCFQRGGEDCCVESYPCS